MPYAKSVISAAGKKISVDAKGLSGAISAVTVTYDLARLMDGATELSCSELGDAMIAKVQKQLKKFP